MNWDLILGFNAALLILGLLFGWPGLVFLIVYKSIRNKSKR